MNVTGNKIHHSEFNTPQNLDNKPIPKRDSSEVNELAESAISESNSLSNATHPLPRRVSRRLSQVLSTKSNQPFGKTEPTDNFISTVKNNIVIDRLSSNSSFSSSVDESSKQPELNFLEVLKNVNSTNKSNPSELLEILKSKTLKSAILENVQTPNESKVLNLEIQKAISELTKYSYYYNEVTNGNAQGKIDELQVAIESLKAIQASLNGKFPETIQKEQFSRIMYLGDSLTERARFKGHHWFLHKFKDLIGINTGGQDRFTNMYTYADFVDSAIATKNMMAKHSKEDIADQVIEKKDKLVGLIGKKKFCKAGKEIFSHNYAEGGAIIGAKPKPSQFFASLILDKIGKQYKSMIRDIRNEEYGLSKKLWFIPRGILNLIPDCLLTSQLKVKEKEVMKNSLILDWAGANDIITINTPNLDSAREAAEKRVINFETAINSGATKFIIFNLPDLSETPRYRNSPPEEKNKAKIVSQYYNELMNEKILELKQKHPNVKIDVYDVNQAFSQCLRELKKNGFSNEYNYISFDDIKNKRLADNTFALDVDLANNKLKYKVLDTCRRECKGEISLDKFSSLIDMTQPDTIFQQLMNNEECKKIIFNVAESEGHLVQDLFTPVIDTPAFKRLNKKEKVIPGNNMIFWDDVHPTTRMHSIMGRMFIDKFLDKHYEYQSSKSPQATEKGTEGERKIKNPALKKNNNRATV